MKSKNVSSNLSAPKCWRSEYYQNKSPALHLAKQNNLSASADKLKNVKSANISADKSANKCIKVFFSCSDAAPILHRNAHNTGLYGFISLFKKKDYDEK